MRENILLRESMLTNPMTDPKGLKLGMLSAMPVPPIDEALLMDDVSLEMPPVGDNYNEILGNVPPVQPIYEPPTSPMLAPPIETVQPMPQEMPQTPVDFNNPQTINNVISALQPLSQVIDDSLMRQALSADKYLEYKKQKQEAEQFKQQQILDSLKMDADIKYRQESLDIQREQNAIAREALIRGDVQTNSGSSYMKDAMILMQQNPSMSIMDAYTLSRSGLPRGVTLDPSTGQAVQIPGFAPTMAGIESTIAGAKTTATGEATTALDKKQSAPKILQESELMIDTIDKTLNHPGLSAAVGAPNPFKGSLGSYLDPQTGQYVVRAPIGTDAKSFEAYLNQLGGQGFLQAYESLRGAAGITNIEGGKAQIARGRLSPTQKEEDFKAALKDLRDYAIKNREKALQIINENGVSSAPQKTRLKFNPQIGDFE